MLRVDEDTCEVCADGEAVHVGFARVFPSPRVERVSPGHLVLTAVLDGAREVVVWRWYDAVVLRREDGHSVRLWEPSHGEVIARTRPTYRDALPGTRVFASAGLPGAEWWVACGADSRAAPQVEVAEVVALYRNHDLWARC